MEDGFSPSTPTCHGRCQVRGFVKPALLLQLAIKPAHGYELLDALRQSRSPGCADPGLVYRTLRQGEREGLVTSSWDTATSGPARRVYELTGKGLEHLAQWVKEIRATQLALQEFLNQHESLDTERATPTQGG